MARACSQDLRDRVIDAGSSARAAADRFGIGKATAIYLSFDLLTPSTASHPPPAHAATAGAR